MPARERVVPLPVETFAAAVEPATLSEETRSVEVVWYAGARVIRYRLFGDPYYLELSLEP